MRVTVFIADLQVKKLEKMCNKRGEFKRVKELGVVDKVT